MEPLPETVEAMDELDPDADEGGELLPRLLALAERAREVVPDLVGVSVARLDEGITFTVVASQHDVAVLDAVQYLAGGPCVEGAEDDTVRTFTRKGDVLDEERWRLFSAATAARTVRSTLTLPLVTAARVTGSVNLYAASGRAFDGLHDELADIFGAWASGAVANADLSFMTRREARLTAQRMRDRAVIDTAIGITSVERGIDVDEAESHLRRAAARAGVSLVDLARAVVDARDEGHPADT